MGLWLIAARVFMLMSYKQLFSWIIWDFILNKKKTESFSNSRTIEEVYDALAERLLSTALKFQDLNLK